MRRFPKSLVFRKRALFFYSSFAEFKEANYRRSHTPSLQEGTMRRFPKSLVFRKRALFFYGSCAKRDLGAYGSLTERVLGI